MSGLLRILLALALGLSTQIVGANSPGTVVYAPTTPTEFVGYNRMICLQHSGAGNGTLLATFEHWHSDASPTPFVIERSRDDGASWAPLASVFDGETGPGHPWPTMFQPCLFELPRALGRYPAGTLLLAGNVCPASVSETHFQLWRSTDHGAHWAYVNTFQVGGSARPGRGIWEPFLALTRTGQLACYFSDERQYATYSQFLGHIASSDGGDTWGAEVKDVASKDPQDRPGMATVAGLPDGSYAMSYEICGPHGCEVRLKTSPDGDMWGDGPNDLGTRPETADGRYLSNSPYLAWAPGGGPDGRLLLTAQFEKRADSDALAPESGQVVFVNSTLGEGKWSWMPGPFHPVTATAANTNPNYSPCLLPSLKGDSVRLMAASGGGALGQERTESAASGLLPYAAAFARDGDAGWISYGGDWTTEGDILRDSACGAGDKAITGSTAWTDYTLEGDVELTSNGQAGLLVHVTNPGVGADALHGYFIGLSSGTGRGAAGGQVFVGRMDGGWTPLASVTPPGGVALHVWYHVTVRAVGDALTVTARRADGRGAVARVSVRDSHFPSGAIGVRAFNATAAWRRIVAAPAASK